jgi:hypothetical protein
MPHENKPQQCCDYSFRRHLFSSPVSWQVGFASLPFYCETERPTFSAIRQLRAEFPTQWSAGAGVAREYGSRSARRAA